MTRPVCLLLLGALALGGGHADAARRKAPDMPDLVRQAEAIGPTDRMRAIALLESALADASDLEVIPWAMLWAGEQRRLSGDGPVARSWFEALAEKYPTHILREAAVIGIALVDSENALSGNTLATLKLLEAKGVPDTMNADRYRLLARFAADEGEPAAKLREYTRKAVAYAAGDPVVEGRVRATLEELLSDDQVESLAEPTETSGNAEDLALARARAALAEGDHEGAAELAETLLKTWPETELRQEVEYLLRRAEAGDNVQAGVVGVMLPITGNYAPVAERLKQVIELANEATGYEMALVWWDTGPEDADIVAGVEELTLEQGVTAILGPLRKELVMEAAHTAQALGVPMVALSQSMNPTEAGDYVFRGFLPLSQQIEALVDHAVDARGLTRFAALHPATSYGETAREIFEAALTEREAELVRWVSYDPAAPDFLEPARELGQKDYKVRAYEYRTLKKEAEEEDLDPDKVVLPPIIDYDALFIPDNYRRTSLVASALAYEEFPVGSFKPNKEAEPLLLLGLNAWNNPIIAELGGAYVENSIFVDAFLVSADEPAVQSFVTQYEMGFGRSPGVLDAVAFDAARILGTAVTEGGASREQVRDALVGVVIDGPVAGGASFGEDREVDRQLMLLTISQDEGVVPWLAPEIEEDDLLDVDGIPKEPLIDTP